MARFLQRFCGVAAIGTAFAVGVPALGAAPADAAPTPGEATELVFIHGYAPEAIAQDCGKDFGFIPEGWQGVPRLASINGKYVAYHHPAYYAALDRNGDGDAADTVDGRPEEKGDVNCLTHRVGTDPVPAVMKESGPATATRNTPIRELALDFARWFRREFVTSRGGRAPRVDVVGHSMGGLIVRAAMKYYWPFFLDGRGSSLLDDVITAGTPHDGGRYPCNLGESACNQQRVDMNRGSTFLGPLNQPPRAAALEADPKGLADFTTVSSGYLGSVFDAVACPTDPAWGLPAQNVERSTAAGHNDHDWATDLVSGVAPDEDHEWLLCNVRHDHYFWPQPGNAAEVYSGWLIAAALDDPRQSL